MELRFRYKPLHLVRNYGSYMRPLALLLLSLICFLAAQGTGISIFFHLFYLLLALLVLSYIWAWSNLHGLDLSREAFTHRAQVGEDARERLTIYNHWRFPKLWVELQDHSNMPDHGSGFVAYLPGHEYRRWSARTRCNMRGKFTLGPATLVSGDPFGIFRLERTFSATNEIIVYPQTVDLPHFELPSAELPGGQDLRSRAYHVTPNVSTVREYAPGDSFNRIHWRSTARTGQLMVKEFELDPSADIYIVMDMQERVQQQLAPNQVDQFGDSLRENESTEEYAVMAAASIARHLLDRNRVVGLIAWGQHREVISAERGGRQLFKMLEALAVVRAYGSQPLAEVLVGESSRFGRNCTLVVITPSLDERWIGSLQQLSYRGGRAVVVLIDPQSFGGWVDSQPLLTRLASLRIPTFIVRQGESLADTLREPLNLGR